MIKKFHARSACIPRAQCSRAHLGNYRLILRRGMQPPYVIPEVHIFSKRLRDTEGDIYATSNREIRTAE